MKIKNPETGEVIVIPQGMEDAVRNAIESGNDPMEVMQMKYGGIYINPANKGKFNATKKATGKTTEELTHSNNPLTRKRAIFAQNAAKWKHEYGGQLPKAQEGDIIPEDSNTPKKYNWNDPVKADPNFMFGWEFGMPYEIEQNINNEINKTKGIPGFGGYDDYLYDQYNEQRNDQMNANFDTNSWWNTYQPESDNNTQPPVLATSSYRAQQKNPYSTTENPISLNPGTNNLNWGQSTSLGNPNYSDPSSNPAAPYNSSPANNSSIGFGNFQSPLNQYGFDNGFNSNAPSYPQPYSGQGNSNFVSPMNPNYTSPQQQPSSQSMQGYDPGTNSGITNNDWKAYNPNASKFDWNSSPNQFSNKPLAGVTGFVGKPTVGSPSQPSLNPNVSSSTLPSSGRPLDIGLKDNSFNDRYNSQNILSGKSDLLGSHQNTNTTQNNKFNLNHLFGPSSNKYFNRAAIFGNAALAGVNATKGILDNVGNSARNARTARQETQLQAKGLRYNNINGMPQNQRYDQNNALLMEFGGNISVNNFKAQNGANVEAEGGEHILTPSGLSGQLSGNSHTMGGENMQLPENSMIFSKKLKDPLTKKSYAQMAKPFSTEKDMNNMQKLSTNKVSKETAQLNIQLKNKKLKELFEQQEYNKATGKHGMEVMYQTLDEREQQQNPQEEAQEQMQPQGQMGYGGMSMYSDGGMPMYDNGGLNNLGFKALPNYVQQNIINNMSHGGFFRPQNGDIYTTQMAYGGMPMAQNGTGIFPKITMNPNSDPNESDIVLDRQDGSRYLKGYYDQSIREFDNQERFINDKDLKGKVLQSKEYNPDGSYTYTDPDGSIGKYDKNDNLIGTVKVAPTTPPAPNTTPLANTTPVVNKVPVINKTPASTKQANSSTVVNSKSSSNYDPEFEKVANWIADYEQEGSSQGSKGYVGGGDNWGTNNSNIKSKEEAIKYYYDNYWPMVKDLSPGLRSRALQLAINTGDPYGELLVASGKMTVEDRQKAIREAEEKKLTGLDKNKYILDKRQKENKEDIANLSTVYNTDPTKFTENLDKEQDRYYNKGLQGIDDKTRNFLSGYYKGVGNIANTYNPSSKNNAANVNAVAAVPGIAPNNNPASGIAPSNNVTSSNANTSTTTTTATPTGTKTTTAINNDKLGLYNKKAFKEGNIDYNPMNQAGNDLWTDANYKTQWIPKVDNAFSNPENAKTLIDRLENYGGQDANDVKLALSKAKTFEEKVAIAKRLATDYKPGPYHSIVNELIDDIPETPAKKPVIPKVPAPEEKETPLGELPKFNYQGQPQPNNYNISLGNFNIPSNLSKDPVALGLTDPSYIDPRYLDIQPQLNDIQRGKSMFQRNLGSRTSTDIGNLLQSQALGYDQAQQAYGQKYNYDQQQDNNAQQFNAQARMNTAERNMNRVDAFNDLRYRRDAAATLQQQNKEQQEIQNSMLQNNYDTRNNFIGEHFSYPGGNTPYSLGQGYASGVQGNDGDYTSMKKNKDGTRTYTYEKTVSANGGLVIKPKKKMKKLK